MYCPSCGKKLIEKNAFCPYCGKDMKAYLDINEGKNDKYESDRTIQENTLEEKVPDDSSLEKILRDYRKDEILSDNIAPISKRKFPRWLVCTLAAMIFISVFIIIALIPKETDNTTASIYSNGVTQETEGY
ncbi:MAG: zinc ribbon domain-containing protein [Clostridiales bacterium]|nr:zinc ribbon domain-containing protein [Clostridiales bacterium]